MFVEDARRLAAADPPRVLVVPVVDAGFAYTFGAQHFAGLPNEFIVICSMYSQIQYLCVDGCAEWVRQHGLPDPEQNIVLETLNVPLRLAPVTDPRLETEFAPRLFDLHASQGLQPPRFVQILVPNADGVFPSEPGYDGGGSTLLLRPFAGIGRRLGG